MSKQAMKFEEIEDCYPDGASVNEYGEIIVSAQWLHDFARKVEEAIKKHDAEPVAWRWRSPMARNGEWQLTDVNPKDWGTTLGIEFEPLYAAPKPE